MSPPIQILPVLLAACLLRINASIAMLVALYSNPCTYVPLIVWFTNRVWILGDENSIHLPGIYWHSCQLEVATIGVAGFDNGADI